ncbi:MAG: FAD-binding oxidoreductase, partial [Candidatus Bathyarchaeia archaeon]
SESAMIIDLSRMNKILDVDPKNRMVRFEPGVTWEKLQEELEKYELMALNPLLPHPLKSALTSHLEREPHLIPKQEYKEPLYSLGAVLPTAEKLRTGISDIPQMQNKFHTPHPPRPVTMNFRRLLQGAQGTLGIVTWVAVKAEYLPKVQRLYFIPFSKLADAVEATYKILRKVIGHECFILNNFNLALIIQTILGKPIEYFEELKKDLPPYSLILCIAGGRRMPEEKIAYEEETLGQIAFEMGFEPVSTLSGITGLDKLFLNIIRKSWPKEKPYWKLNYKGLSKDIFFITTLDRVPTYTNIVYNLTTKHKYPSEDIGIYIQPLEQGRACHCEYGLHINPNAPEEVERVNSLFKEVSETLLLKGAFFSRPYGEWAPMVYNRCASYFTALRKIKGIFDPNRIMNPGKLCL